jgi:hypothetical protein
VPIKGYAQKESKMANTTTINVSELVSNVFGYTRTDNGHQTVAVTLGRRFVKEDKAIKTEDSKGFKAFADAVRKIGKDEGVKVYYTSFIKIYEKDVDGNWVRDEFGDRVSKNVGGFLFEMAGKDPVWDEETIMSVVDAFKVELEDGVNEGRYVLAEEKKATPKAKRVTKTELEAENNLLKKQMAEMMERLAALEKAAK